MSYICNLIGLNIKKKNLVEKFQFFLIFYSLTKVVPFGSVCSAGQNILVRAASGGQGQNTPSNIGPGFPWSGWRPVQSRCSLWRTGNQCSLDALSEEQVTSSLDAHSEEQVTSSLDAPSEEKITSTVSLLSPKNSEEQLRNTISMLYQKNR